jgi:hypothetical protein
MSLTDFKPAFDNAYQEIFPKVLVGKGIANMRFEPVLKAGESVERVALDISAVKVRTVTRGSASTIDAVTDSAELLQVNIEQEVAIHISDGEVTQAGPQNPMERLGGELAQLVASDLDSRILYEAKNAYQTFDTGDLTTLASTGVPIVLSSTSVPQMVGQMPAKLIRGARQLMSNLAMVVDAYSVSQIEQYLLGKQFDIVNSVFKNGYTNQAFAQAEMYVSENLTGEAVLTDSGTFGNTETFTINGVTFTMVTTLSTGPAVAGEIVIGNDLAASMTNIAAALNAPGTTSATFTALSAANQAVITGLNLVATATATTVTIVCRGSGRLTLAETGASTSWSTNFIHAYYGKKGGIDVVVQDMKETDFRPTADRRGTNVFASYLAGVKTFSDGAKKFLDVQISA